MAKRMRPAAGAMLIAIGAFFALPMASGQADQPRERGAYLVTTIAGCGNCHSPRDAAGHVEAGQELSGGVEFDLPLGHIVAPNITPDRETGIGNWTAAQIITALREGKRPDGSTIGPPMPFGFYRQISDSDATAIAAYLQSVPAVRHAVAKSQYKVPLPPNYGPAVEHVDDPPRDNDMAYGRYLAGPIGHCMECHTPFAEPGRLDRDRLGAGGRDFPVFDQPGVRAVSRNITPDPENGIGKWSDADIKRAITEGVRPDGTKLAHTMAFDWYARMTPDDLDDIVAYLRSLEPVK
ncbi:MAG TPA: c-type cytochrome [Stellaceae bacterium]|nr:c-type cytochrome [Stellaceae bacterium]